MIYGWSSHCIRLFGRWDRSGECACTVNTGSTVEFRYEGKGCVLLFDTTTCVAPFPHLWIELDGVAVEAQAEEYIHVRAREGVHSVKLIVKSAVETQHRWYAPLEAVVRFRGVEADTLLPLEEDRRPIIEFVGDSITEGILIEPDRVYPGARHPWKSEARVYQDDVCLDYSYLTAEKLGCRARVIGFGAVGSTQTGSGHVPPATQSYPYVYDAVAADEEKADLIVINHGANDRGAGGERYKECAKELIGVVRRHNPDARIVYMSAFCLAFPDKLREAVEEHNREEADDVRFIDATHWVPEEPLHPLADGHEIISGKLADELRNESAIQRK